MSFLATTLRTTASATPRLTPRSFQPLAATGSALSAPFHTSQPSLALRETDKDRDNVAEYYDAEKHDQLKATKEKKADWRQELASESESNVKADRNDLADSSNDMEDMQRKTENLPNRKGFVNKTQ